jgi:hypothetical protein
MARFRIDVQVSAGTAILTPLDQPGLPAGDTFRVKHGDTIAWLVRGAPGGSSVRVKVTEFPTGSASPHLFGEGDALAAVSGTIQGTVHRLAAQGHYRFAVEKVDSQGGVTPLRCLWSEGEGQPAREVSPAMGGGIQTDPPPG